MDKVNPGARRPDTVPASLLAGASSTLPEGWHADEATGLLLRDTVRSMLRRRNGWNYKGPGLYMITLTLADRSRGWLGELEVKAFASTGLSARELARGRLSPSLLAGSSLWAEGFNDSILWTAERRARATRYLKTNPYRLAIRRFFPNLFKVQRDLVVDLGEGRTGHFSAIGNHFLIDVPVLAQVQCSRSFFAYRRDGRGGLLKGESPAVETAEFREKWALASKLASTGAVLVSPCISEGEREIARRAFEAGYKVITLANKGFSPLYKPGGKLFETCAEGNLLMLAPAKWPYQPGEKKMTRTDALTLNQLASWIVGTREQAPEHLARRHYKGAVVADVEKLALGAVGA